MVVIAFLPDFNARLASEECLKTVSKVESVFIPFFIHKTTLMN